VSDPHFERPDLAPLRAAASQAEFAEAFRGLLSADGYPLAEGEPLTPLACDVARSLIEAGFTLHHCDRHDPLYRLGGGMPGADPGGIRHWPQRDRGLLDYSQPAAPRLGPARHLPPRNRYLISGHQPYDRQNAGRERRFVAQGW
jgi:hypothetical protein